MLFVLCAWTNLMRAQEITCKIRGTVVGRESSSIFLLKETEDIRFTGTEIPVKVGNQFEYDLKVPVSEQYTLIFKDEMDKGIMRPIYFFPENGIVELTLFSISDYNKNVISGGKLNKEMGDFNKAQSDLFNPVFKPFYDALDSLYKANKYYSHEYLAIQDKLGKTEDQEEENKLYKLREDLLKAGKGYTPAVSFLNHTCDSINRLKTSWVNEFVRNNQDEFGYSLILKQVREFKEHPANVDLAFIREILPAFSRLFPSHPYTAMIRDIFNATGTVVVGGKYVDCTASTLDGKEVRLSDIIAGKVALIDLWASWCGPCRARSKSMIAVYEKYKSKGFVVIGIACEYDNTDALKIAMAYDNYPWLNLVELNNKNGIWNKYNVTGGGGSTFLVDATGKILAILPDKEEADRILEGLLK